MPPPLLRLFSCVADHEAWWSLYDALAADGLARDPVRLISAAQPGATAFHHTIPARYDKIVHTEYMLLATQRQLGVPLSCLRDLDTDPYGDGAVNANVDFTIRHNEVLPAWISALRHAYRSRGSTSRVCPVSPVWASRVPIASSAQAKIG